MKWVGWLVSWVIMRLGGRKKIHIRKCLCRKALKSDLSGDRGGHEHPTCESCFSF
jgi:hypothetical protein